MGGLLRKFREEKALGGAGLVAYVENQISGELGSLILLCQETRECILALYLENVFFFFSFLFFLNQTLRLQSVKLCLYIAYKIEERVV